MADETEAAAAVGDPRVAFVTGVFVRFQRSLLRYVRHLLVRREDPEDVAQETYLRLVSAAALDGPGRQHALFRNADRASR